MTNLKNKMHKYTYRRERKKALILKLSIGMYFISLRYRGVEERQIKNHKRREKEREREML